MVAKIKRIIILKKRFNICIKIFFFAILFFFCFSNGFIFKFFYLNFLGLKIRDFFFSFNLDIISIIFLCMVFLVTSLVLLFREFYIEHYNNKKFFFITISFLSSIVLLSSRGSVLNFMIGWDGLGISSLCLIMFYSNKTTIYNSFITFFFNRLGDVILMVVFCFILTSPNLIFFLSRSLDSFLCFLVLCCSFTKRAQFPLSSWLPAAISAPTPISAIVHSSTLVTAGIFFLMKMFFFLQFFGLRELFGIISICTFLIGGLLANLELDLKKIVAFSTISQISMIILILSIGFIYLRITHTFLHALFKTLLFCSCGTIFLFNFSNQLSLTPLISKNSLRLFFYIFFRIFRMRGLIFSSSFFTKDVVLEFLISEEFLRFFILFSLGGIATIIYRRSILDRFSKSCQIFSSIIFSSKNFIFRFILIFGFFTLYFQYFLIELVSFRFIPVVTSIELLCLLFLIFIALTLFNFYLKKNFSYLNFEIVFRKFFSFSYFGKVSKIDKFSFQFNDQLFFKPRLLNFNFNFINSVNFNFFILISIYIILIYFIYSISLN